MGKHAIKVTGFRFTDQTLLDKLAIIAKEHKRNRNQEVEYALDLYVKAYERENGPLSQKAGPASQSIIIHGHQSGGSNTISNG